MFISRAKELTLMLSFNSNWTFYKVFQHQTFVYILFLLQYFPNFCILIPLQSTEVNRYVILSDNYTTSVFLGSDI